MEKYVECAIGRASNRKFIIEASEGISKLVQNNPNQAIYQTIFQFDARIFDVCKGNRLIGEYEHDLYIEEIPIDIDKGSLSDEEVLENARKVLHKLEEIGFDEDSYQVYYSGTGYHIHISARAFNFKPSPELARDVKEVVERLLPDMVDTQIYHKQGLIRSTYSANKKSGYVRYKVPLTTVDFKNDPWQEIISQSESKIEREVKTLTSNIDLSAFVGSKKTKHSPDFTQSIKDDRNEQIPLDRIATCINSMMSRGPAIGSRHETIMRIASHFKKNGIPCKLAIPAVKEWFGHGEELDSGRSNEEAVEFLVKYTYRKPYRYGCNDKLLQKFCRSKCIYYKNRHDYSSVKVFDVNDLTKELQSRAKNDIASNILELSKIFGYPYLDIDAYGGELITIAGITGGNKTTLAQNIVLGYGLQEDKMVDMQRLPCLYLSLEVPGWLIHRKNLQIVANIGKKEALKLSKHGVPKEVNSYLQHISIVETRLDTDKIEALITDTNPSWVVIDYIDLVKKHRQSESYALTDNMTALRNMASRLGVIIIVVTQVNREASKERKIDLTSGKGSSSIENSSFKFISITGDPAEPDRVIRMHKNTDGQIFGPLKTMWTPSGRLKKQEV